MREERKLLKQTLVRLGQSTRRAFACGRRDTVGTKVKRQFRCGRLSKRRLFMRASVRAQLSAAACHDLLSIRSRQAVTGTPMRHSQLSNEQILLALSESYNIIAAITKYQVFLASAIGLPKDDTGRIELMAASMTVLEKIRTEIRALEHELDRREDQEKRRL
jgi:hypothetical protein